LRIYYLLITHLLYITSLVKIDKMKTLTAILVILSGFQTFACDCILHNDLKLYLPEFDMVFTGKVVELIKVETDETKMPKFLDTTPNGREQWKSMHPDQLYARVVMIDNIKGDTIRTDTLLFTSKFTNCDPIYEQDQSYLFFADYTKEGQYIMTHCTPWGRLEKSQKIIKKIKAKHNNQ